jgi:hypothetical protein
MRRVIFQMLSLIVALLFGWALCFTNMAAKFPVYEQVLFGLITFMFALYGLFGSEFGVTLLMATMGHEVPKHEQKSGGEEK